MVLNELSEVRAGILKILFFIFHFPQLGAGFHNLCPLILILSLLGTTFPAAGALTPLFGPVDAARANQSLDVFPGKNQPSIRKSELVSLRFSALADKTVQGL